MTLSRFLFAKLAVLTLVTCVVAQDKAPNADKVQALEKKFQDERAAALEKNFPTTALVRGLRRTGEAGQDGAGGRQYRCRRQVHQGGPLAGSLCPHRSAAQR